jgi:hypothetical protein
MCIREQEQKEQTSHAASLCKQGAMHILLHLANKTLTAVQTTTTNNSRAAKCSHRHYSPQYHLILKQLHPLRTCVVEVPLQQYAADKGHHSTYHCKKHPHMKPATCPHIKQAPAHEASHLPSHQASTRT